MDLAARVAAPDVADMPDWAVAAYLNQPDPSLPAIETWSETRIGVGAILDALGPSAGAEFLDALQTLAQTQPVVRWGLELIRGDGLDLSRPSARSQLAPVQGGDRVEQRMHLIGRGGIVEPPIEVGNDFVAVAGPHTQENGKSRSECLDRRQGRGIRF